MGAAAEKWGEKFPSLALASYHAYEELEGHLTEWAEGLSRANREKSKAQAESTEELGVQDPS